jgi:hypothetical protein
MCVAVATPLAWAGGVESGRGAKETLCHRPPGDPMSAQTILVARPAVAAHLAHGDSLGKCSETCPPVESSAVVSKTGQTACWDSSGAPVGCAGTGQDGEYQNGASASPRFTDNSDGTVTDNLTKLTWLKDADCFGAQNWGAALTASNTLATGACGLTDGSAAGAWRLPNENELHSLISFGTIDPALPAGYPFIGVQSGFYWSSTSTAIDAAFAWYVSLSDGTISNTVKANALRVWPVRGGQ